MPMKIRLRNPFRNPIGLHRKVRRAFRRLTWKKAIKWAAWSAAGLVILSAFLFAWYARDLPTPGKIRRQRPIEATQILDRNGNALYAVFGEEKRMSIPDSEIPDVVKKATIAIEDKNFYEHYGVDILGIARGVILKPLSGQRAQGGSTITQQYVKNALLSPERTVDRKIKELILALELEAVFTKDEILALYLNEIPYGSNAYGIEAAAETFFNKHAKDLTLAQAATLAALPQRPTYYSPYGTHVEDLMNRQKLVLSRMQEVGFITEEERLAAEAEEIAFIPRREQILAPHFVLYVRDLLVEKYGEQMVLEGGLRVTTTLDIETQRLAEQAIATAAEKNLSRYQASNAALVSVDPATGQVLAMVGSVDYFDTENQGNFNVATASRQPGSSFKPLVYATGFKDNWNPASVLWDVPTDFGGNYKPQNYNGRFSGPTTIRSALANSLNIPAVKMLAIASIDEVIEQAQSMGITTLTDPDRYGLSLVLGGAEVKPLEMAAAYGVFAAGGTYHQTSAILRVEDSKGRLLDEWRDEKKDVLAPEIAYQITHILNDNNARTPTFGARSPLYFPGLFIAAKTGTTQEYRDAWTVGYGTSIATAVWVGNNDNSPMNQAGGSLAAAPIFHEFMVNYYKTHESIGFARPDSIREFTVDLLSGKIPTEQSPDKITDIFAPWQIPTERDDIHVVVKVNRANGKLATSLTPPDLIEERLYTRIHSEQPKNPNWENPVRAWAESHGYQISEPPTETDDTAASAWPTIQITSPTANQAISGNFTIVAEPAASAGVRHVNFYIDGVSIGTATSSPWQASYNGGNLTSGHHEILAEVTDNQGATARATVIIVIVQDQTPPDSVTDASATAQGIGTGGIKLSWQNPNDNDLAKIRIYRSTTSGQLGTPIIDFPVDPSTASTTTATGLTPGTTYYFTLRPIDEIGNENTTTTQVSATAL